MELTTAGESNMPKRRCKQGARGEGSNRGSRNNFHPSLDPPFPLPSPPAPPSPRGIFCPLFPSFPQCAFLGGLAVAPLSASSSPFVRSPRLSARPQWRWPVTPSDIWRAGWTRCRRRSTAS
eukprot:4306841-Pyramimonas_sp.AAC.1